MPVSQDYYVAQSHSVAMNPKAGSSTLAKAIVLAFYRDRVDISEVDRISYSEWHFVCPREEDPSKPVVLVVREPVKRFLSAVAHLNAKNVNAVLHSLENGEKVADGGRSIDYSKDIHLRHQHHLLRDGTAFPMERLDDAARLIGLSLPLPVVNESSREKPVLTREQEQRVLRHYAADEELYRSLL